MALLRFWRYREVSRAIAAVITSASLGRVDKTLIDAYSKATAQGASPQDLKRFDQAFIDKINEALSRENALRVRQWTEAILEEESKMRFPGFSAGDLFLFALGAFLLGRLLRK
jgi:hypothetical protein